jgi:imidazoleglycerol phosphate synthase glutamine amidotransferase subunit HisH
MVSSYTANLAAFLTIENPSPIIENVQELFQKGEEGKVTYGAKKSGSTIAFFRDAEEHTTYGKMYKYMLKNWNTVMLESNEAGLNKAKSEKYAYFMESSTIEYIEQRHCDVAHVGSNLDQKGYAIGMKKGNFD